MSLSPLAFALMALSGCIGFILGTHSDVRLDLGDPVKRLKTRQQRRKEAEVVKDWPVILPRRPLTVFLAALTVTFLVVTIGSVAAWVRAAEAQSQAADAQAKSADAYARLTEFVGCYTDYQSQFVEGYSRRVDATAPVSDAIEDAFRLIRADRDVEDDFNRVMTDYLESRREQREAQRENPIPPIPDAVCGDADEVAP